MWTTMTVTGQVSWEVAFMGATEVLGGCGEDTGGKGWREYISSANQHTEFYALFSNLPTSTL